MNNLGKIPAYRIHFDDEFRTRFHNLCDRILSEQYFTDHSVVKEFEEAFAKFSAIPFATAVTNGTTAIQIALQSLDVRGKEVILPTNTFIATANAIECAGGIPVLVDIEENYFGIDPRQLEKAIHKKTAAVIAVHVGGLISTSMSDIVRICESHGVPLVEDCAHAHGCTLGGKGAGSFGYAGCFSFFPTKVITAGEGGMIVTRSDHADRLFKSLRRFGHTPESQILFDRLGSNGKMTEFQAAMGVLDLARSQARIQRRVEIAAKYRTGLAGSFYRAIAPDPTSYSTHYKQIVVTPVKREGIDHFMKDHGVNLGGGVYFTPLHGQPVYSATFKDTRFPTSDWFSGHHICLPCYPELEDVEVERIIHLLLEFQSNAKHKL